MKNLIVPIIAVYSCVATITAAESPKPNLYPQR